MADDNNNDIFTKGLLQFLPPRLHAVYFLLKMKIHTISRWSVLRTIGNQRIIQFTILVPIIGYYIIFSTQFCDFSASTIDIGISCTENAPSQKTFELYFAFVFLGLASLFYSLFCPKIIKQYKSEIDMIHSEEEHLSFLDVKTYSCKIYSEALGNPSFPFTLDITNEPAFKLAYEIGNLNRKKLTLSIETFEDPIQTKLKETNKSIAKNTSTILERKASLLKCAYFFADLSLQKTRITILALYTAGFAILLWHGVATFISIYLIYYNSTPTHFIRLIVDSITSIF